MNGQVEKAQAFRALHVKGAPLVLWNIWDAGSARAVAKAGAPALATGSWSVAAAQGYADGEALPLADVLRVASQIAGAVDLPVSVDFEGGYASEPGEVGQNVEALIGTGAIGVNFEDRIVGAAGLHDAAFQAERIAAIRAGAERQGVPVFINARTDVFFSGSTEPEEVLLQEVVARAQAYAVAGADGLFVPGLARLDLIAQLAEAQPLPLNIMRMGDTLEIDALAGAGVARVSHGPGPYQAAMAFVTASAKA